jgi:hypothetical protein
LRIGMQVAAGLEAAHAQGLVHRDVKPSNILLENGVERVKLSDFGLARAADDASLTQSGTIAGTPMYMAPEQARGEAVDHRADLFSLGSVLYTMCTGRPPFRAANTVAVLQRVCADEPRPLCQVNPEVPAWLADLIAHLHAKLPEDRIQSAAEVSRLLGQYLAHRQHPARVQPPSLPAPPSLPVAEHLPEPAPRRRRVLWVALTILAVLLLAPCLLAGALAGLAAYLLPPLPPLEQPQKPQPAAREGPHAELGNGKLEREPGGGLRFQVDYDLRPEPADATLTYVWVVRRGERTLYERELLAAGLPEQGTLRGQTRAPPLGVGAGLKTHLESKRLVPGQLGWQRERISNVVTLAR